MNAVFKKSPSSVNDLGASFDLDRLAGFRTSVSLEQHALQLGLIGLRRVSVQDDHSALKVCFCQRSPFYLADGSPGARFSGDLGLRRCKSLPFHGIRISAQVFLVERGLICFDILPDGSRAKDYLRVALFHP